MSHSPPLIPASYRLDYHSTVISVLFLTSVSLCFAFVSAQEVPESTRSALEVIGVSTMADVLREAFEGGFLEAGGAARKRTEGEDGAPYARL